MQDKRTCIFLSIADLPRAFRLKGVFELPAVDKGRLADLIKLDQHIVADDIDKRSKEIAALATASLSREAVLDLPLIFVSSVEHYLFKAGVQPLYAIYGLQRFETKEKKKFEEEIEIRVRFDNVRFEKVPRRM
jgi:hypothetical protein